jgi:hypothetical protein
MRWVKMARALLRPIIALVNEALRLVEKAQKVLMNIRYVLVRADMRLAAEVTLRELNDLIRRLKEGKLCGYAEDLGLGSDEVIAALEDIGCVSMKVVDFDDMINYDTVLGCPRLRREVTVSSNIKIREWVCISWREEEEEKLRYEGEPVIIYVDELEGVTS